MIDLLAQAAPPIPTDWLSPMLAYGPLGLIFIVLIWFVIWYGPKIVASHLAFVDSTKQTQESLANSLETLTETAKAHGIECKLTRRGVKSLAAAGKAVVPPTNVEAHKHLDNVNRDSWQEPA